MSFLSEKLDEKLKAFGQIDLVNVEINDTKLDSIIKRIEEKEEIRLGEITGMKIIIEPIWDRYKIILKRKSGISCLYLNVNDGGQVTYDI